MGQQWMLWAVNGCMLRISEIVDSDMVVPEDCLPYVACKLVESPDVVIIQHELWGGLGQYLDES